METLIGKFSHGIATGVTSGDAGTLALVALAIRHKVLVFDKEAASGKGRWTGTTKVVDQVLEATAADDKERVAMVFTKSKVNKAATVLTNMGSEALADETTDKELVTVCKSILGLRTLTSLYNEITGGDKADDDKPWSLSQALSTVVAKARKEGIEDSTVLETLVSILSGE